MPTLYNDTDPKMEPQLEAAMIPHALAAFETPATAPAWAESAFDGRRAYIRTLGDQCNPPFLQDLWLKKSRVEWEDAAIETSHCPFVSNMEETATVAVRLMRKWH